MERRHNLEGDELVAYSEDALMVKMSCRRHLMN